VHEAFSFALVALRSGKIFGHKPAEDFSGCESNPPYSMKVISGMVRKAVEVLDKAVVLATFQMILLAQALVSGR
jgi:hypothetical protein